jgi:O-antigen/teichoic acid export membrane protein
MAGDALVRSDTGIAKFYAKNVSVMSNDPDALAPAQPIWRILRNTSWSLGGKAIGAVLSIVYLAMIARSLGPVNFGRFALIFSFAQVIYGLVAFPTWQIIIRYGTKFVLDKQRDKFAQLVWICLAMDLTGFLIGSVIAVGALYGFAGQFGIDADLRGRIIWFTLVLILSARNTVIGILRAHDRFRDAALADSLVPIIRFVGVILVVYIRPNVESFLLIWVLSEIATTAILWIITLRSVDLPLARQNVWHIPNYYRQYPDLTRFTGFTNIGASLRVLSQQFIVLIVGLYTGPAAAGFFRLGHQLGQVLARISDGLSIAFYAEHNRMSHLDADSAVASMITRTVKVMAISAAVLLTILLLLGKPMLVSIFGAPFAPAYPFVILLGGAAAVQLGSSALEPLLLAKGNAGWALLANLAGAIALLIALFALIPEYNALGASAAVLIGAIVTTVALTILYRRMR